jgi:hypothetical protein
LREFENRELKRIFEAKTEEAVGRWSRKTSTEKTITEYTF